MPVEAIPFGATQESGNEQLAGASPLAVNVLIDGKGAIRRRPGLATWDGFPTTIPEAESVDGIATFDDEVYWVNSSRRIYKTDPTTATATNLSTGGPTSFLAGTGRPVFAETQFRLVIAGGSAAEKVDSGATAAERLGGSPPNSTQIVALASRLVSDDLTSSSTVGHMRFTRVGDSGNETWDALDFVTAEARPDPIVALRENSNELFVLGESTVQVFSPDPTTVLAPGRTVNRGCIAAASVVVFDEQLAWLDEFRRFVVSDGRSVNVISDPIASTLKEIETVTDCWGFHARVDAYDVLVWVFPSDGRSFCWQIGGGWSQWQGWNGGHTVFPAKSHCFWSDQDVDLVGLSTGQIAKLDPDATTDLGDTIKAEIVTGFLSHGTDAHKSCDAARFTFKRGEATTTAPQVLLSWRDDTGAYCNPIRMDLGTTGDTIFTVEKRSLGTYRRRQWKLEFTDAADFVLAGAEEVFTVDEGAN